MLKNFLDTISIVKMTPAALFFSSLWLLFWLESVSLSSHIVPQWVRWPFRYGCWLKGGESHLPLCKYTERRAQANMWWLKERISKESRESVSHTVNAKKERGSTKLLIKERLAVGSHIFSYMSNNAGCGCPNGQSSVSTSWVKSQFWQPSGSIKNEVAVIKRTLTFYFLEGKQEIEQTLRIGIALRCHELDLVSHAQTAELFIDGCSCL